MLQKCGMLSNRVKNREDDGAAVTVFEEHIMINISSTHERDKEIVSVSGSLTVEHAMEMKTALQNAFKKKAKDVVLSLGAVTKTDLTFFQLVCSAHKAAMTENKFFTVEQFPQDGLKRALGSLGFAHCHGCVLDKTKSCLFVLISS
jgi:anti-anti-sigma regulatory factor